MREHVEVYERSKDMAKPKMTYKTSSESYIYNSVGEALIRGRNNSSRVCMESAMNNFKLHLIEYIINSIEVY